MSTLGVQGPILVYEAGADVAQYRIVKPSADEKVIQSTAAVADAHIGVANRPAKSGNNIDVCVSGAVAVEYGGAITRGEPLKADASGKALKAAAGNRTIGVALKSGVKGDIGLVLISPGTV